ncbi:putative helicase [Trypanosoma cruzi]|nr:putative helicase [Trypanosoma cruzi]
MGFHASLELESTCKRCFYIFESPRTLWPCGHTFCQQCLPFMFTEQGELICEECGSLCEVGYTPNLALELVASYQVMQHTDYDDDDDDDGDGEIGCVVQRRSIEEVLTAMLKDLMSTQTTIADAPRKTAGKAAPHPLELVM